MIKAVFFDFDGVLTTDKTGSLTTTRYLSRTTGIELPAIKAAFSTHNRDLTLGKTTYADIWPGICGALGRELSIDLLGEAFDSTPMNAGMLSLAHRLKNRHVVGIITDNKQDRIDRLRKRHGLDSLFSPIVVSAEVGADKEGPEIFLHALSRAGVGAGESIFVDNDKDNLLAPAALGMKTLFHDDERNDVEALHRALAKFGVRAGSTC